MRNKVGERLRARDDVANEVHVRIWELHGGKPRAAVLFDEKVVQLTDLDLCESP